MIKLKGCAIIKTMESIFDIAEKGNKASIVIHKNNLDFLDLFIDRVLFFNPEDLDASKDLYVFFCDNKFKGWTQNKDKAIQYFNNGYPCFKNSAVVI